MKFFLKLFFLIVALPAVLFFSFQALDDSGFFALDKIEIEATTLNAQKSFLKPYLENVNSRFEVYKGKSLFQISIKEMAATLGKEKWIKQFRIQRSWPSSLHIHIEPHTVAFLMTTDQKFNAGTFLPVTTLGDILNPIDTTQTPSVALLKGDSFLKNKDKRKKAIELVQSLPETGIMSADEVLQVGYGEKEGFWVDLIHKDMRINFGEDEFSVKAMRAAQVIDYIENRNLKARVIDANLSKKVLVRLRQNP